MDTALLLLLLLRTPTIAALASAASKLHARNRHLGGYDIEHLAEEFPPLQQHVVTTGGHGGGARARSTIDFAVPAAVESLNVALLTVDYGVRSFRLPEGHLCPAVPGRADYLHILADLLARDNGDNCHIPRGQSIRGLDIGVGASCVYPLLGHAEYGWSFLGSDVDVKSIESASAIAQANEYPIELCRQTSTGHVLKGVLQMGDGCLAFTMCNPPFYASAAEEAAAAARKWRGLHKQAKNGRARDIRGSTRSFGGSEYELWCPGGEKRFITTHIRESAQSPHAALWFTSLVSSKRSMPKLLAELSHLKPARIEELGTATGNKAMRVLAWSFIPDAQRRERLTRMIADSEGVAAATKERHEEARKNRHQFQRQASTTMRRRRACFTSVRSAAATAAGIAATAAWRPSLALADLASAGAGGLPMLGRFEKLKGANAFIGTWKLYCTDGPSGLLSLLRDGDVELRSGAGNLIGTGVAPWSYRQAEKGTGSTSVPVRFSVDVSGSEWDVLYFSGAVDAEGGPERRLEGSLSTGYGRRVGDFVASLVALAAD